MRKYNVQNYIRYKEDLKRSMPKVWSEYHFSLYTRDELIVKFLPLVENLARKFSTSQQASGVLTIMDLIQIGGEALIKAVDKLDWNVLNESEDMEKTLKSFFSKRIKGGIRRRIDMHRGDIRIPEHKMNEIRKNPKDKKMYLTLSPCRSCCKAIINGGIKKVYYRTPYRDLSGVELLLQNGVEVLHLPDN